mgnify:CR=1 FL=1|tara:strand:- start:507 stop:749 length:243 start_codon:yes stop_codon:yes gene_type:complete
MTKTRRTVTLPNGKTAGRKFPEGQDAFAVIADNGLVGWSGSRRGADSLISKAASDTAKYADSQFAAIWTAPNARIVVVPG